MVQLCDTGEVIKKVICHTYLLRCKQVNITYASRRKPPLLLAIDRYIVNNSVAVCRMKFKRRCWR